LHEFIECLGECHAHGALAIELKVLTASCRHIACIVYCGSLSLSFVLVGSLSLLARISLGADISRERTRDQERSRSTCAAAGEQANERRSESTEEIKAREPKNHALIRSLVSPNRLYATNPLLLSSLAVVCLLLSVLACACAVSRSLSLSRSLSGGFDYCSHSHPQLLGRHSTNSRLPCLAFHSFVRLRHERVRVRASSSPPSSYVSVSSTIP